MNQNTSQPLNITQGTAIVVAAGVTYVLDNGPNTNQPPSNGQIFAYTLGSNGSLQAEANGYFADTANLLQPELCDRGQRQELALCAEPGRQHQSQRLHRAALRLSRSPTRTTLPQSPARPARPVGTGAGPQCILEDPSNQFIYTANFNSSNITGLSIDQNAGNLTPLSQATKAKDSYALPGPATWCVATGRTS